MHEFEEVKQYINETVRKELAPTRVLRVHVNEGLTSFEEEPAYRINVIFDGDLPGGKKTGNLNLALQQHLWAIKDQHFPIVRYIRAENEEKLLAPR